MRTVVEAQAVARPRSWWQRLFGVAALTPAARRSYDTALGDTVVGELLDELGQRWDVLHDVPAGSGRTIDHVAIGPAGAFVLRAAHCGGGDVALVGDRLTIGGMERADVADLVAAAATADAVLGTTVTALFVAVAPGRILVDSAPTRVAVVTMPQLRHLLLHTGARLSGDEVAELSDRADRADAWPPGGAVAADDDVELRREFAMVRAGVTEALRRRTGWAIVVFAVGAAIMCTSVAGLTTFLLGG